MSKTRQLHADASPAGDSCQPDNCQPDDCQPDDCQPDMVSRWSDTVFRTSEGTNNLCDICNLEEFLATPATPDSIERIAKFGGFINLNTDAQLQILDYLQASPAALKAMIRVFAEFATPYSCVSRPELAD
jgi:hypothetical protein